MTLNKKTISESPFRRVSGIFTKHKSSSNQTFISFGSNSKSNRISVTKFERLKIKNSKAKPENIGTTNDQDFIEETHKKRRSQSNILTKSFSNFKRKFGSCDINSNLNTISNAEFENLKIKNSTELAVILEDTHQKHRSTSNIFLKPFSSLNRKLPRSSGQHSNLNSISNTIFENLKIKKSKAQKESCLDTLKKLNSNLCCCIHLKLFSSSKLKLKTLGNGYSLDKISNAKPKSLEEKNEVKFLIIVLYVN